MYMHVHCTRYNNYLVININWPIGTSLIDYRIKQTGTDHKEPQTGP